VAETLSVKTRLAFFSGNGILPGLVREYALGRAPQALVLSGPFGVGKTIMANLLAMSLFCEREEKPCGQCAKCRQAERRGHANLISLSLPDKGKTVKVEQARALLAQLSSYPFLPGPRLVMLNDIDTFTPAAQNALLKVIEEPDASTFFLLTATGEKAVLPTIRSRCRGVRLPVWPESLIAKLLIMRGIPEAEAEELAVLSGGSPGMALRIRDDAAFWAVKRLADENIISLKQDSGLPAASRALKDARDHADMLLDYTEGAALHLLQSDPYSPSSLRARKLLEALIQARQHRASNVSWQAISDKILLTMLEE
jgi:DNA polymerase-3 subunit delta'